MLRLGRRTTLLFSLAAIVAVVMFSLLHRRSGIEKQLSTIASQAFVAECKVCEWYDEKWHRYRYESFPISRETCLQILGSLKTKGDVPEGWAFVGQGTDFILTLKYGKETWNVSVEGAGTPEGLISIWPSDKTTYQQARLDEKSSDAFRLLKAYALSGDLNREGLQ